MRTQYRAFSDPWVLQAVNTLVKLKPNLRYEEIAEEAGCSVRTVIRALDNLEDLKLIRRSGKGKRAAFNYEVLSPEAVLAYADH